MLRTDHCGKAKFTLFTLCFEPHVCRLLFHFTLDLTWTKVTLGAQGKVAAAQEALEQAVGMSFGIRESAAYATIRAQLLLAQGKDEEAERLLQAAMGMPGVKRQQASQSR